MPAKAAIQKSSKWIRSGIPYSKRVNITKIKGISSMTDLKGVKKFEGYSDYLRIKVGDHRLGIKQGQNKIELICFLHRKEIYRRSP